MFTRIIIILICKHGFLRDSHILYHCKNKIVKITNLLVSTVARNSGNSNLIGCVGCYGYACNYNLIIVISISLYCLLDVQRNRISILIEAL